MKSLKILMLSAAIFVSQLGNASAQGIPVYDASSFAQLIAQVDAMADDYQKQIEQLEEAVRQSNAITGTRNMGDVANGLLEQQLREYLPNTWQDTMNIINSGNVPNGALGTQSIYNDLFSEYSPLSGADLMPSDPTSNVAKAIDRRTGTTYAAMSASEQAYNNIPVRMQTMDTLLNELNNSDDLKTSVDLQARIAAENGIALNELMRLNAIRIQQNASVENEALMNSRRASSFNVYDPTLARQAMELPNN
ncbi:MAG: type IV secretion system protein [Pseudomonadota bacterium]